MNGQRSDGADLEPPWRRMAVVTGEIVAVEAAGLVSGGYEWAVLILPDGVTDVTGVIDEQAPALGRTSTRTILLRGDVPGAYDVVLGLVRPWEPVETPPVQLRTIALQVDPRSIPGPDDEEHEPPLDRRG